MINGILCSIRGRQLDPPKRVVECCSLEILRRGGLILFCDYVVGYWYFPQYKFIAMCLCVRVCVSAHACMDL